jgi:hypothetical protein
VWNVSGVLAVARRVIEDPNIYYEHNRDNPKREDGTWRSPLFPLLPSNDWVPPPAPLP